MLTLAKTEGEELSETNGKTHPKKFQRFWGITDAGRAVLESGTSYGFLGPLDYEILD